MFSRRDAEMMKRGELRDNSLQKDAKIEDLSRQRRDR